MRLSFLLATVLLVSSLSAQQTPWIVPLVLTQQYFQLTWSQVNAIFQANFGFTLWLAERQAHISEVRRQISEETAKEVLDPLALGTRYAEVEGICREIAKRAESLRQDNIKVLTDPQKAKLKILSDAMQLANVVSEAQSVNLLPGPAVGFSGAVITGSISAEDRFNRTDGTLLGVSGCGTAARWIETPYFRPLQAGSEISANAAQ